MKQEEFRTLIDGYNRQPVIKVGWHLCRDPDAKGDTAFPATFFLGRMRGLPKRAAELVPGDVIMVPYASGDEQDDGSIKNVKMLVGWGHVNTIDWAEAEGVDPDDWSRAAGDVICQVCGKKYLDHPYDKRFPDEWQPGGGRRYSLQLLCDGTRAKL